MIDEDPISSAAEVWAPSFPRRVSEALPDKWRQSRVQSNAEITHHIKKNAIKGRPGFVSVYAFPDGHTSDEGENIPRIDTLFFDMDRDESQDDGTPSGWARDMSALLTRSRMVAQKLIESGKHKYWRAALSGHKGVHLYLDFDPIPVENGNEAQFREGMKEYTAELVNWLEESTGTNLSDYMDVSSGRDLARLTRLPNSLHEGATERFGEPRYCVPVSIRELAKITPKKYIALTKQQRPAFDIGERITNDRAHEVITRKVRNASGTGSTRSRRRSSGSYTVESALSDYEGNDDVTLKLLKLHLKQKPCIWAFRQNPDAFKKGDESHIMEMNVISAMKNLEAPVDVMHEFFEEMDGYDEQLTNERIAAVIGASVAEDSDEPDKKYRGLNCETVIESAPSFCLGEQSGTGNCRIWDREFADSRLPN